MIDLFAGPSFIATRTQTDYEFTSSRARLGRTQMRPAKAKHWADWIWRLLGTSTATRHTELEVLDADDTPQWLITLLPDRSTHFVAEVSLLDGTPIGRAATVGSVINPFPKIELTEASGHALGHATSSGTPEIFDTAGEPMARYTWEAPTQSAFGSPQWGLTFLKDDLTAEQRAVIVAAVIGWELPR